MVLELDHMLSRAPSDAPLRLLNVGAGDSLSVERQLKHLRPFDLIDRIDIEPTQVDHPNLGRIWQCSLERMSDVRASEYDAVFANFVLEHVRDLRSAAFELRRVVKPGGLFVATLPNTAAPEFLLARATPTAFHRFVRQKRAWETAYSYGSIADLTEAFASAGFRPAACTYFPVVGRYLAGYPVLGTVGGLWDRAVRTLGTKRLMGEVCIVLAAPSPRDGESTA
jgi:SAM-dependent methyltransferase